MLYRLRTIKVDKDTKLVILSPSDSKKIFSLVEKNRDYLGKWLPWVENTKTVEDSHNFIITSLDERKKGKTLGFGIKYKGKLVGHISIMHLSEPDIIPEIGYWISGHTAGLGIMTKCTTTLTQYCFKKLNAQKINIIAEITNFGSNKVAQKSGYKRLKKRRIINNRTFNIWQISKHTL